MTQDQKQGIAIALKEKYGNRPLSMQERMTLQAEIRQAYPGISDFGVVLAASHIDRIRLEDLT